MKSQSGHVRHGKDGLLYGFKAQYHHDGQTVKYGFKMPWHKNEKAAIIRMRKIGFAINAISDFTGRSVSTVHAVLKKASSYDPTIRYNSTNSMRKLPYQAHTTQSKNRWVKLLTLWQQWEMFLMGDLDKPP